MSFDNTNKLFVGIVATEKANAVLVTVDHYPSSKHIAVAFYPAVAEGPNFDNPQIVITDGKYVNIEPMTRFNRTKVAAEVEKMKTQIAAKAGPYYDKLMVFAAERGFTIK